MLALGRAEICLADSTADYLVGSRSRRVSACVLLLNCVAFFFCLHCVQTVCISIRISHHSSLCLFEMKASCTCGGHWVLFYKEMQHLTGQISKLFIVC